MQTSRVPLIYIATAFRIDYVVSRGRLGAARARRSSIRILDDVEDDDAAFADVES